MTSADRMQALVARVLAHDRRSIARALTVVERGDTTARDLIGALFPHTGRAHLVGITGVGGVGKSSLIARLIAEWRRGDRKVGVVAVDPSSALTGGALLGDRVRMEDLLADTGIFIRSMASRGGGGGLARAAADAARVLDAAGCDVVVVETIGVGQDEIEIAQTAETVVLVEAPNLGDDVQALKAGLLEVADVLVVNKADQPNADRAVATLRAMLQLEGHDRPWTPPIVKTSAATGDGVPELVAALDRHLAFLSESDRRLQRAAARARAELRRLVREEVVREVLSRAGDPDLTRSGAAVGARVIDPYRALAEIVGRGLPRRLRETPYTMVAIEREGDVVLYRARSMRGVVELLANGSREGDTLTLREAHIDGPGAGSFGVGALRKFARALAVTEGVRRVVIFGWQRTSGANVGRTPRPVVIEV